MDYSSSNALQSDRENGEHLESSWSVIVFQRKRPIRREKLLASKVWNSLKFCNQFTCLDLFCDLSQHNKHSWDILSVHGFPTLKVINLNVGELMMS